MKKKKKKKLQRFLFILAELNGTHFIDLMRVLSRLIRLPIMGVYDEFL